MSPRGVLGAMWSWRGGGALGVLILGAACVVALPSTVSWSDGVAGGTAQVPQHLSECAEGFRYCKVQMSMCGGCHGEARDMRHEGPSGLPVTDRIGGSLVINGDATLWEYEPGQSYFVAVGIVLKNGYDDPSQHADARPPGHGQFSDGAFALNASTGRLSIFPANDDTVRITGGIFQHQGSHHPDAAYDCPNDPPGTGSCRYGGTQVNETPHAGEAASTYEGSFQRAWTLRWTAPASQESPGVMFRLSVMIPNGDGLDSCVYEECKSSLGYSDQSEWDWWTDRIEGMQSPSMPDAAVLCDAGRFASREACQDAVLGAGSPPEGSSTGTTGTPSTTEVPPVSGSNGAGPGGQGGEQGSGSVDGGSTGSAQASQGQEEPALPIPPTAVAFVLLALTLSALAVRRDP